MKGPSNQMAKNLKHLSLKLKLATQTINSKTKNKNNKPHTAPATSTMKPITKVKTLLKTYT